MSTDTLDVRFEVRDPGDVAPPFPIGAHPAWRRPLADGVDEEAHASTFAEPEPIRRLDDDALSPDLAPSTR